MNPQREGIDLVIRHAREGDVPRGAVRLFREKVLPGASQAVAAGTF